MNFDWGFHSSTKNVCHPTLNKSPLNSSSSSVSPVPLCFYLFEFLELGCDRSPRQVHLPSCGYDGSFGFFFGLGFVHGLDHVFVDNVPRLDELVNGVYGDDDSEVTGFWLHRQRKADERRVFA